jgi:hypothetical protein
VTEIEDVNSPKIQTEMQVLVTLNKRVAPVRLLTAVGAPLTSFWLVYVVYRSAGFLTAFVWFIGLGIAYKFGPSPMWALAASVLAFWYEIVGVWFPIVSYVAAAILLYVDIRMHNLKRRVDPFNLGSIHDA